MRRLAAALGWQVASAMLGIVAVMAMFFVAFALRNSPDVIDCFRRGGLQLSPSTEHVVARLSAALLGHTEAAVAAGLAVIALTSVAVVALSEAPRPDDQG